MKYFIKTVKWTSDKNHSNTPFESVKKTMEVIVKATTNH